MMKCPRHVNASLDFITSYQRGVLIDVHVQPRARFQRIAGVHGQRLKIQLTSPPVQGKANKELREFLAGVFGVSKSKVTVAKGDDSRIKRIRISDVEEKAMIDIVSSVLVSGGKNERSRK
jgi:uncharacterized protein